MQFRRSDCNLDTTILDPAKHIHGSIISGIKHCGSLGGLTIWLMDRVPGETILEAQMHYGASDGVVSENDTQKIGVAAMDLPRSVCSGIHELHQHLW